MNVALVLAALYLAIAVCAYWFMLGIPSKSGHRVTMDDMVTTTRREGLQLAFLALLWFPILCYLFGASAVHRLVDRGGTR
jgi:hypothetical protein